MNSKSFEKITCVKYSFHFERKLYNTFLSLKILVYIGV